MATGVKTVVGDAYQNRRRTVRLRAEDGDISHVIEAKGNVRAATIQVTGTFDSGVVTMQVSNDGVNPIAIAGTAISISSANAVAAVLAGLGFKFYHIAVGSGGASQDLAITVCLSE